MGNFTDEVRLITRSSGISSAEIGRQIGVTRQAVHAFVTGRKGFSTPTIERLLGVLRCRVTIHQPARRIAVQMPSGVRKPKEGARTTKA